MSQDIVSREKDALIDLEKEIKKYDSKNDLKALENFITASNLNDKDLALRVYCAMLALNQAIQNADVAGIKISLIKTIHIWMNSEQLMLMATKNGEDIEFDI